MQADDRASNAAARPAVDRCLQHPRCNTDGVMAVSLQAPGAPVWIVPYFPPRRAGPADDVEAAVRRPCTRRALAELVRRASERRRLWNDFEARALIARPKVDAWDSAAALFLLVADRFRQAGGTLTVAHIEVARRAFACVVSVTDPTDGLTWAKPDYRVKYLMDNIEVRAGLLAAERLFVASGRAEEARDARERAERLGRALDSFWLPERRRTVMPVRQ